MEKKNKWIKISEVLRLFNEMLRQQFRLKKWLENLDKIDGQVEFNQWELQSILKDFLIDELKAEKTKEQ